MTGQQIIDFFELLMDDTSELSSTEELSIANRIYKKICITPLECLKKEATGTLSASVAYVSLPADFLYIPDNPTEDGPKIVYVGTDQRKYKVVSFQDRRAYKDQDGYCYVDVANSRLVFTKQPSAETYSFDYIYIPADLTLTTSPVFPICHEIIAYGVAVDSYIIQQFDKARSYASENQVKYESCLSDLKYYNSNLIVL